jgi:hypothetical protein
LLNGGSGMAAMTLTRDEAAGQERLFLAEGRRRAPNAQGQLTTTLLTIARP